MSDNLRNKGENCHRYKLHQWVRGYFEIFTDISDHAILVLFMDTAVNLNHILILTGC